jgi:hypothetical protein
MRACWRTFRTCFGSAFRDHVDGMMRDVKAAAPPDPIATYDALLTEELTSMGQGR